MVNVSSIAGLSNININQLNRYPEGKLKQWKIYGQTKTCNILFTIELAARLKNSSVTTYSLHPGLIKTEFFNNLSPIMAAIWNHVIGFFMKVSCIIFLVSIHKIGWVFRVVLKERRPVFIVASKKELNRFLVGISTTVTLCHRTNPSKILICLRNCGKLRKNYSDWINNYKT